MKGGRGEWGKGRMGEWEKGRRGDCLKPDKTTVKSKQIITKKGLQDH